jgi:hypothetical protein
MEPALYRNLGEVEAVVRKFESCEYGVKDFDHGKHLTVAAFYLCQFPLEEAMIQMRSSLLRFTKHHGVKGYHETITRFWLVLVAAHLQRSEGCNLADAVNGLAQLYRDKNTLFDYYTSEIVMSEQAREDWLVPDLKPLPEISGSLAGRFEKIARFELNSSEL